MCGIDELDGFRDPVLEQVADVPEAGAEQPHGVAGFEVLGQDHDADLAAVVVTDVFGGDQSGIAVGWHADVDDSQIGSMLVDGGEQFVGVASLLHDVHSGSGQDASHSGANDRRVVGDDHPHGMSARSRVPRCGGLSICNVPEMASSRSARPRSPEPPQASAPPSPSSLMSISR